MKKLNPWKQFSAILLCLFLVAAFTACDRDTPGSTGCNGDTPGPGTDPGPTGPTGILPVPDSLDGPGPFEVADQLRTGPNNQYRLIAPKNLGQNGIKHPIVVFPAGGVMVDSYKTMLYNVASHGFVVIGFLPTLVPDLTTGLDWLIAENDREESMFYGKLDTSRIAPMGQSFGALMAFQIAADPRIITSIHLSGGTLGEDHAPVKNLHAPALFLCGENPEEAGGGGVAAGDMANVNCEIDFEVATTPVFYAVVEDGTHVSVVDDTLGNGLGTGPDDPARKRFQKAIVGWLRWQLADDESLKDMFVGDDCGLCGPDSGYIVKQKDL